MANLRTQNKSGASSLLHNTSLILTLFFNTVEASDPNYPKRDANLSRPLFSCSNSLKLFQRISFSIFAVMRWMKNHPKNFVIIVNGVGLCEWSWTNVYNKHSSDVYNKHSSDDASYVCPLLFQVSLNFAFAESWFGDLNPPKARTLPDLQHMFDRYLQHMFHLCILTTVKEYSKFSQISVEGLGWFLGR